MPVYSFVACQCAANPIACLPESWSVSMGIFELPCICFIWKCFYLHENEHRGGTHFYMNDSNEDLVWHRSKRQLANGLFVLLITWGDMLIPFYSRVTFNYEPFLLKHNRLPTTNQHWGWTMFRNLFRNKLTKTVCANLSCSMTTSCSGKPIYVNDCRLL